MNHDSDISNLMAQIGGLRSELSEARVDLAEARMCAMNQSARADRLAGMLTDTLVTCAELRAERDALQAAATYETILATDATDPGPTLVAETRDAFPINALRGGDGTQR